MRYCIVDKCLSPIRCGGYCTMHYSRWRRGTPLDSPPKQSNKGRNCPIDGCTRPAFCVGLCQFHNQRRYLGIPYNAPKQERDLVNTPLLCAVIGCVSLRLAKGLCGLHWQRAKASIPLHLPHHFNWIYTTGWRNRDRYKKVSRRNKTYSEHRLIATTILGRDLLPHEVVHHKDEDKTNNHPNNLEVMTRSSHTLLHNKLRRIQRERRKMLCLPRQEYLRTS